MKKIGGILCVLGMVFLGFVWSVSETHAQLLNNNSSNSGYDTYYSNPGGTVGVGKYSGSDTGYTRTDFSTYDVPSSTTKSSATTSSSSGSGSSADNGKIFRILESKIYDTLMDLREIVYMIAGFGLVMFTVMAIFNKISYKHLGYIMIGLSLLALMFPFIEYFSGYTTEALRNQRELTFRSFLDPNVSMERIQGTGYKEIVYPSYQGEVPSDVSEGGLSDEELASLQNQQNFALPNAAKISVENTGIELPQTIDAQIPDVNRAIYEAGCDPRTMKGEWDETTMQRLVCSVDEFGSVMISYEACEGGKIKNGTCKATAMTTLNNIVKGTQAAMNTTAAAIGAVTGTVATTMATVQGAKNIADAIENGEWGGDNFMDAVNNIYGSTQNLYGVIQAENNIIGDNLTSTVRNIGATVDGSSTLTSLFNTNYENNPYGSNGLTDWWTATDENGNYTSGFRTGLTDVELTTGQIQTGINQTTGSLGEITRNTYDTIGMVDEFTGGAEDRRQAEAAAVEAQRQAEQQAFLEQQAREAAERAAEEARIEAQRQAEIRAWEEEMRRAQEEALRQEQQRQAQLEAQNRAAEEEMRRAQEDALRQQQTQSPYGVEMNNELYKQRTQDTKEAFNNLTQEQLAAYVEAGLITEEQALTLAMTSEVRKATQARNDMEKAQQAMKDAQEQYETVSAYAEQANEAVRKAEEKVKNAQGGALMEALWDLQYAKEQADKAQEAMNQAQSTYNATQETYKAAEQAYNEQKTKADEAETKAEEATGGRAWNRTTDGDPYMNVPNSDSDESNSDGNS